MKGVGLSVATDDLLGDSQLGLLLIGDGALLGITGCEIDHSGAAVAITTDSHNPVAVDSSGTIAEGLRDGVITCCYGEWTKTGAGWISGDGIVNLGVAVHLHVKGISSAIATDDLFGHGQLGLLLVGDGALLGITGREIDHAGAAVAITTDGHSPVAVHSGDAVAKCF